jgi:plastocyanin
MKKAWPFLVVVVVIVAVAAVALGNKNDNNATTPPAAPSSNQNSTEPMGDMNSSSNSSNNPVASNKVSIENFSFTPANITVKKGTTVVWTNNDTTAHTVTADTGNAFDSGTMEHGKTFSFTFNDTGTFKYHCTFHSGMHGTVTVTE